MDATRDVLDTVADPVRAETVVSRSRFVADLAPIADAAGAQAVLAAARREFHAARHQCSAFVTGHRGDTHRSSDDGEPSGTAGAPILAVLQGAELSDVVLVVTRYFGGTLLGAGGLVRAYGEATTAAVERATRVRRRTVMVVRVLTGHADAGRLEHRLRTWARSGTTRVEPASYGASGATIGLAVSAETLPSLRALLDGGGIPHDLEELGPTVRRIVGP